VLTPSTTYRIASTLEVQNVLAMIRPTIPTFKGFFFNPHAYIECELMIEKELCEKLKITAPF